MRGLYLAILIAGLPLAAAAQAPTQSTPEAQSTPQAITDVYACASIQDGPQRLACYDAAVGRLRQAEGQGQIVAVDRTQVASIERESFGFSLPSLSNIIPSIGGERSRTERIEAQVERVSARGDGRHIIYLANGQAWAQVEPQNTRNLRAGDTVTIRRATFGSYMLSPARGGEAHRVRREE